MKSKMVMIMGSITLIVALAAGVSYAWFTDKESVEATSVEAGYLDISLAGNPDSADKIFPADDGKMVAYAITNESDITVVAQFKSGVLTAYVMPDAYLDNDGNVLDEKRAELAGMSKENKEERTGTALAGDVVAAVDGSWSLSNGSSYLGKDDDGNQYFRLAPKGTAGCNFNIGLTAAAGNQYQYALFSLGDAGALATQDKEEAILDQFGVVESSLIQ